MKWILFIALVSSCASSVQTQAKKVITEIKKVSVYNGKIKYIKFKLLDSEISLNDNIVKCVEQGSIEPLIKKMPFQKEGRFGHLYYAESYHSKANRHECFIEDRKIIDVTVKKFPYKEEFLKVTKGKVVLNKKNQARAAKEWHMTQKIYKNSAKTSFIEGPYKVPLNSYITSHYGNRRVFNNLKKTQHLGNDFRARVGVPISSSNRGKVVYAGNLFYTGDVVIVDHGLGLFSLYAHLSKIKVKVGHIVHTGEIVGLSGRTGRVSGPHLHWGIKNHGFNIDGFSLVEESKQHFSAKNEFQSEVR